MQRPIPPRNVENLELLSPATTAISTKLLPGLCLAPGKRSQEQTSHGGKWGCQHPQPGEHGHQEIFWGRGYSRHSPPQPDPMQPGLSLHSFCQNPSLSCPQGREQSRARKKQSPATEPECVHPGSGHISLPTSSGQTPASPSRGGALLRTAHSLRRDSGEGRSPAHT